MASTRCAERPLGAVERDSNRLSDSECLLIPVPIDHHQVRLHHACLRLAVNLKLCQGVTCLYLQHSVKRHVPDLFLAFLERNCPVEFNRFRGNNQHRRGLLLNRGSSLRIDIRDVVVVAVLIQCRLLRRFHCKSSANKLVIGKDLNLITDS
jgi:hypothetical protein